jgi:NAD+ synthase (glutamine-hydrolysing)
VFPRQVTGLARRLAAIGCRDVTIGLSGGLDSALALLVAVGAFDLLGLDSGGIHVYTMPGFGTTRRTRFNAEKLCAGLGLELEVIDITRACLQHFKDISHPVSLHDVVFENSQARERTQILMDKANQTGGIVLGTGDMSEIALGWCTYNGDHMSMFGVNSGVPKTAVRDVCRWWAAGITDELRRMRPGLGDAADAVLDIVATPVSPELLPARRGRIVQKTESAIGPYELHDFFLWHFVAESAGKSEILKSAKKAFRGVYGTREIAKWLDVFLARFFSQSFKRNCVPDGVQVFPVYLAPSAWHVPSDIARPVLP